MKPVANIAIVLGAVAGILGLSVAVSWVASTSVDHERSLLVRLIATSVAVALAVASVGLLILRQQRKVIALEGQLHRSELRELEHQLVRAEKLITVGVLSAGIAHEIGSPLAVIRGRAEQVLRHVGGGPPAEDLRIIIKHIDNISSTIRQLLDFSRRQPIERRAVSLQAALGRARGLLEWKLEAKSLTMIPTLETDLPMLAADPDQLQQVLVNLMLNACDASAPQTAIHVTAAAASDQRVRIEIIDRGQGIAAEHMNAVFDPFFTTKERGEGTGLGLSIVASIVRNHGGQIDLTSSPGNGTTVTLLWPTVEETSAPMRKLRALVVDDVVDMAQTIANDLEQAGFETEVADGGATAIERFNKEPADVVVTDLRMRGMDGLDLLDVIKRADPSVPVIIMTAFGGIESAVESMRRGAFHYVAKPFELATLRALVERACRERVLSRENALLRRTLRDSLSAHRLLGQSAPMRQLRALIERVAAAASPVLITGETGTGKELVALAIHTDGPRGEKPFIAVNCAALPEPLLESELFGHARGAFTGASQSRRGLFAEADEGTLFLDEVGDLPVPLQGKLLRVLQSGEVRPVGSETARTVDVRCIAATHKDLSLLVEKGLFREDLFFRLDVLRVPVPPLRERSEDITVLVEHFLEKSLARSPRSVLAGLEADALDFLGLYSWPGNVRQLENLIERLVVTASTPLAPAPDVRKALASVREGDPLAALLKQPPTLEALEAQYTAAVLQKVGGNKAKAAEILGIDLSTLYRREKQRP